MIGVATSRIRSIVFDDSARRSDSEACAAGDGAAAAAAAFLISSFSSSALSMSFSVIWRTGNSDAEDDAVILGVSGFGGALLLLLP